MRSKFVIIVLTLFILKATPAWCGSILLENLDNPVVTEWFDSRDTGQEGDEQKIIAKVDQMPNEPSPYVMRDWKQVAFDYDAFVFDFQKTGDYLPVPWWDDTYINFPRRGFGMASYIGRFGQSSHNAHESINCMGAVLGATLAGIDKSHQWCPATNSYQNWVLMQENYFNSANGQNLYLNNIPGVTGGSFWYEVLPNILFYQLNYFYPETGSFADEFIIVADRWYDACVAMGGQTNPWTLPDFNYTAFNFSTMAPVFNGIWRENDAAAGIAWIEYMAYLQTGDQKYLMAVDWCLEYLEQQSHCPLYDLLYCFAPYIAIRANLEQGRSFNADQLLTWCFEGNQHGWGIQAHRWGDYDCHGLVSSVDYAFNMETLNFAGAIVPIARYDQGYARAIGKWMLNLANSVRLFYPDALPAAHQTGYDWASVYDSESCIGYEGLKRELRRFDRTAGEQTVTGMILSGSHLLTQIRDDQYEVLRESNLVGGKDGLEHTWSIPLTSGFFHQVVVKAHIVDAGDGDNGFNFSWAVQPDGPFTPLFTFTESQDTFKWQALGELTGTLYLKVKDTNRIAGNANPDSIYIDEIYVDSRDNAIAPYASGDPLDSGWGNTDFGLYGSSYIGILGGIVSTTNVEKILGLDLLKTDYYRNPAYPTTLYFNPFNTPQAITIDAGTTPVDLYDTVSHCFLARDVSGPTPVLLPPDNAVVLVQIPSGGRATLTGGFRAFDGVIVDYHPNSTTLTCAEIIASENRLGGDINGDCRVNNLDLQRLAEHWLLDNYDGWCDLNRDQKVNLLDFHILGSDSWLQCNDPLGCP